MRDNRKLQMIKKTRRAGSLVVATPVGNQSFPVRVWILDMCKGKLSAVISRLMSVKRVEVVEKN